MEFTTKGKKFVLRGANTQGIKLINNKSFSQVVQQGAQICFLYMDQFDIHMKAPSCQMNAMSATAQQLPIDIEFLLEQHADIFVEPAELPPSRPGFDHCIPLREGTNPFNLRPYNTPSFGKTL